MQNEKQRPDDNPTHQGHADTPKTEKVDSAHPPNTGEYPSGQGNPETTGNRQEQWQGGQQSSGNQNTGTQQNPGQQNAGNQQNGGNQPSSRGQQDTWTGDRQQGNMNPGTNEPTGMASDMNQAGSVPGGQGNVGDRASQVGSQGWSEGEDPTQGAEAGAFKSDRSPVGGDGGGPEEPEETTESNRGSGWHGGGK